MPGFDIYDQIREGCQRSAAAVAPILNDLFRPQTIVDVGGGEGWWAVAFHALGVKSSTVDFSIPADITAGIDYLGCDLNDLSHLAGLVRSVGACDLALCLEVGEHLHPVTALPLVETLCTLAPVVAFSAAVPGQGGQGHVNEQWPGYWVNLFNQCGYVVSGALRWRLWGNPDVEPWYQQNLLIAVRRGVQADYNDELFRSHLSAEPIPIVHPVTFAHHRGVPAP